MIHYRDLQGNDLGVPHTTENVAAMRAAIRWTEENIHRGAVTYVWCEGGKLYFGGPWLGTDDLVDGVYVPQRLSDPRTSWGRPWPRHYESFDDCARRLLGGTRP
jgi:hypothetical protein